MHHEDPLNVQESQSSEVDICDIRHHNCEKVGCWQHLQEVDQVQDLFYVRSERCDTASAFACASFCLELLLLPTDVEALQQNAV